MQIKDILKLEPQNQKIEIQGWVRTKRAMKNMTFIEVNDGSCLAGIQCVYALGGGADETVERITTGAAIRITGLLTPSPATGQKVEAACKEIEILGEAGAADYPLQKKRHSLEFLRTIPHLRGRTRSIGAVMRIRSRLAYATHNFFQERGFFYIHTPVITTNDAEGAGSMFQVTTLDLKKTAAKWTADGVIDYKQDFFGKKAYLTVSGQLEGETYATALSRIYTFGPTFRAENSNTSRHLAEFWMIEPEAAFFDIHLNMELAEDFLKYLFADVLKNCEEDMAFFDEYVEKGIIKNLEHTAEVKFERITYTDAVLELEKNKEKFEFKPFWGCDLQTEHEKFLTETVAKKPVIVTDYPKGIKAFYMKQNKDGKTVRAMDVLVPKLGEIIGGSERETDMDLLENRINELGMKTADYTWYLDLRRYGSVPHSGFGLGFERLVQYVTGMANIRDCIPYPRTAQTAV
ncbi:MAG: asparagine--tRNA ligase [Spirochaetaceae bacterium]|jgi:asparaginyl-tRNA synthetase|nr:asparagine--tRNA ligase [Spirochaetaceae bacterium]